MPFTPLDAEKERFRIGFRGYARDEVERFRALVISSLEEHIALESQLRSRVAELESQVKRYRETEDLLKDSVVLAQRTCDELIAAAHQKADVIRQEAHQEGSRIRAELAELRSQREQFEYAFHGLLAGFTHRLEQGNPALAAGPRLVTPELTGKTAAQPEPDSAPPRRAVTQEDALRRVLEDAGPARPEPPAQATAEPGETEPAAAPGPPDATGEPPAGVTPQPDEKAADTPRVPEIPRIEMPRVPRVPAAAAAQDPPAGQPPANPAEVDRDADIEDFAAALDNAPGKDESGWMDPERQEGLFGILDKLAAAEDEGDQSG